MEEYLEVLERFKKNGIQTSGLTVFISGYRNTVNGESTMGIKESEDGKWVCIPRQSEEVWEMCGEKVYVPECYEVVGKYTCFLGAGTMLYNSHVWLLR